MNRSYDIEDDVGDDDEAAAGAPGRRAADPTPIQYQPESGALDPVEAPAEAERDRDPREDI